MRLSHQLVLLLPEVFCWWQLVPVRSGPAFQQQQVFQKVEGVGGVQGSKIAQLFPERRLSAVTGTLPELYRVKMLTGQAGDARCGCYAHKALT